MIMDLCPRGAELMESASRADRTFKASIIQFFSNAKKDEDEMRRLESLGELQRDADEAFRRHQKLCTACAHMQEAAVREPAGD